LPFSLGGILDRAVEKAKERIPGGPDDPEAPQP